MNNGYVRLIALTAVIVVPLSLFNGERSSVFQKSSSFRAKMTPNVTTTPIWMARKRKSAAAHPAVNESLRREKGHNVTWFPKHPLLRTNNFTVEPDASSLLANNKSDVNVSLPMDRPEVGATTAPPWSSKQDETAASIINLGSPVTIVVQLSGEMGNNLAKIATGRGLQLWARHFYGIETDLVLRHQEHSKWVGAMKDLTRCFPKLRNWDFQLGNGPNYGERLAQQNQLLGTNRSSFLHLKTSRLEDIHQSLSTLRSILQTEQNVTMLSNSQNITLPFLLADRLSKIDLWPDMLYDEYRKLFEFDDDACCKSKADPVESVFHFRNYAKEMPHNFKRYGFEELSPNKTADELFRDLKLGDRIAITSRFASDPVVQTYVDRLSSRGIQARVVEGQSGVEDFCFLMSAKKELVGCAESTFVAWAGYLGNADKVRLYSIDSPARRRRHGDNVFTHFNWTNPQLKRKVVFELYSVEDS